LDLKPADSGSPVATLGGQQTISVAGNEEARVKKGSLQSKTVWIDLDNSPHVPFFAPIIEELESRGCSVVVTARDCFQVRQLADLHGVKYSLVGRHYGKAKVAKLLGLGVRSLQLTRAVRGKKPDLAVSHGSRAQLLVAAMTRIPSMVIVDYEFARGLLFLKPGWVMVPDVIPDAAVASGANHIVRYPGIKEDVYVPRFKPGSSLPQLLGLKKEDVVVTVRPPATEAHYHVHESDELFQAAMRLICGVSRSKVILLPRTHKQEVALRAQYANDFDSGKIIVPAQAVDGLDLIWHSDLVISGGGTMNREAAAMGVPVYSVFRGKTGAVDRYLAAAGRLVLLETVEDVRTKIVLKQRERSESLNRVVPATLNAVVNHITQVLDSVSLSRH